MSNRVFIHHDGALGDLLLSLATLRAIRNDTSPLHLAGRSDVVRLLKASGFAGEISDAGSAFFAPLYAGSQDPALRTFLTEFDTAFVLTTDTTSRLVTAVRDYIPSAKAIATIPPDEERVHVSAYRLRQVGVDAAGPVHTLLSIPSAWKERAASFLMGFDMYRRRAPLVILHPGSGSNKKNWPWGRFLRVTSLLRESHGPLFLFLSGPAEANRLRGLIDAHCSEHPGDTIHVSCEELPLTAALLSMCDLYIGNDSGITHLAASVSDRVIALFGPTDPVLWAPANPASTVLSAAGGRLSDLSVETVIRSAERILAAPLCSMAS